jgi:hypothetical protein
MAAVRYMRTNYWQKGKKFTMHHEGGSIATFKVHFHIGIINLETFVLRLHFLKVIGPATFF